MENGLKKITQNQQEKKLRELHHSWAKGFHIGETNHLMYHPYTKKDFKFDCKK